MRLYVYEIKWDGDEQNTYVVIEANTKKDAQKKLNQKCKEKEWSTEFIRCECKRLVLEDGFYLVN